MTWGDTYRRYLAKGHDHGSAAYEADRSERRAKQLVAARVSRLRDLVDEARARACAYLADELVADRKLKIAEEALRKIANAIKLTDGEWKDAPRMRFEALLRNVSDQAAEALKKMDGGS